MKRWNRHREKGWRLSGIHGAGKVLAFLLLALLLVQCGRVGGGEGEKAVTTEAGAVASITITPGSTSITADGVSSTP
ncbi:MAG: hypothetical protein D6736_15715, partial [Nitrospinota bacterium]